MKQILKFIETVYLKQLSLGAQKVWLRAFISMLNEKQKEIEAQSNIEEIQQKLRDGVVENAEEYSAKEIKDAIEQSRRRIEIYGGGLKDPRMNRQAWMNGNWKTNE